MSPTALSGPTTVMETQDYYKALLIKFMNGQATDAETRTLFEELNAASHGEDWRSALREILSSAEKDPAYNTERWEPVVSGILASDTAASPAGSHIAFETDAEPSNNRLMLHPITGRRTRWLSFAAAVLLVAAGYWFYRMQLTVEHHAVVAGKKSPGADITAAGNKAILTLSDGKTVVLDSAANGAIARQGSSSIIKLAGGQIAYTGGKTGTGITSGTDLIMNTMTTPCGGQYQLILPGGTRVWLNAASSITYPVNPTGRELRVKINGEAYFEVVKNKQQPFIVDIEGKSSIEVLGTHFNVNAYANEETIRTTLLEGNVKVSSPYRTVLLKPGQQAEQPSQATGQEPITVLNEADTAKAMAWKNGLFNFEGASLPMVMRELERWYDIRVKYETALPAIEFSGGMDRGVNLSTILKFIGNMQINYKMEGRTLILSK
jgi:ferric-dicitrate binding protein FerR (iron transport regulator)